mgnify:CR=1 FL=1
MTAIVITLLLTSMSLLLLPQKASGELFVGHNSTYQSIQDALDDAAPGEVIVLEGGEYNENLTVNTRGVLIKCNSTDPANITGSNVRITIDNVTIENIDLISCRIHVSGNDTSFSNVTFDHSRETALSIRDSIGTTISECTFLNSDSTSVEAINCDSLTIFESIFLGPKRGLNFTGGRTLTIENSTFAVNESQGINVVGSNDIEIVNSVFSQSGSDGTLMAPMASFDMKDTCIHLERSNSIEFRDVIIQMEKDRSKGISAIDCDMISVNQTLVDIESNNTRGVDFLRSDNVTLKNSEFDLDGFYAVGAHMEDSENILLMRNRLDFNDGWGVGIRVKGCKEIELISQTIQIFGANSTGISVTDSADINLTSNQFGLREADATGANLSGKGFLLSSNDLVLTRDGCTGYRLDLIDSSMEGEDIFITSQDGIGLYSTSKGITVENTYILQEGTRSRGAIITGGAGTHQLGNVTIEVTGTEAMGVISDGGKVRLMAKNLSLVGGSTRPSIYIGNGIMEMVNSTVSSISEGIVLAESEGSFINGSNINGFTSIALVGSNLTVSESNLSSDTTSLDALSGSNAYLTDTVYDTLSADIESYINVYNTISIKVLDKNRDPVVGVDVEVENLGESIYSTPHFGGSDPVTDEEGAFEELVPIYGIWNDDMYELHTTKATFYEEGSAETWFRTYVINTSRPGVRTINIPDIDRPMTPINLTVRPLDLDEKLLVQWDPNTDDTTHYLLYNFSLDSQGWELLDLIAHPQTSWISSDLGQNTTGIYRITAFDGKFESRPTAPAYNTTLDLTKPAPPTDLSVSSKGTDHLIISWTPPEDTDLAGYEIEINRSQGFGFDKVGEAGPEQTSYNITGLSWGVEYTIRVRAFDHGPNYSPYSDEVTDSTKFIRFSITVNVSYSDSGPLANMKASGSTVIIRYFNGEELTNATTDVDGIITITGLEMDRYIVNVRPPVSVRGIEGDRSGYLTSPDLQVEVNTTSPNIRSDVVLEYYEMPQYGTVSVVVTYSGGSMDDEAANNAAVDLQDEDGVLKDSKITGSGGRATFTIEELPFRGKFLVAPPDYLLGVRDSKSGYLPNTTNFFQLDGSQPDFGDVEATLTYYDYTPPPAPLEILSATPKDSILNLTAPIIISFNQAVDRSSVISSLQISPALNDMEYIWSDGDSTLTIHHADFIPNREYTVTLTNVAESKLGTTFPDGYTNSSWTFKTVEIGNGGGGDDDGLSATTLYIIIGIVAVVLIIVLFMVFRRPKEEDDFEEEFFDEYEEDFGESPVEDFDEDYFDDEYDEDFEEGEEPFEEEEELIEGEEEEEEPMMEEDEELIEEEEEEEGEEEPEEEQEEEDELLEEEEEEDLMEEEEEVEEEEVKKKRKVRKKKL